MSQNFVRLKGGVFTGVEYAHKGCVSRVYLMLGIVRKGLNRGMSWAYQGRKRGVVSWIVDCIEPRHSHVIVK